jgi:hypothetical protein
MLMNPRKLDKHIEILNMISLSLYHVLLLEIELLLQFTLRFHKHNLFCLLVDGSLELNPNPVLSLNDL